MTDSSQEFRRLRLWPDDVRVEEFGDRAELIGPRVFELSTPYGPARLPYQLYRIRGGTVVGRGTPCTHVHAEFTFDSWDGCSEEQIAWMHDHRLEFRHALRLHLEEEVAQLHD